jgi:hypothetical protein
MSTENKYIKSTIFWDVTLCNMVGNLLVYWRNIPPPSLGLQSKPSKQSNLVMENVVWTEGWAEAPERTDRSKERSKGMELLKGAITVEIWEKMEEPVVQTQGSLHCLLGLGLLFDLDIRGTIFLQNACKLLKTVRLSWIASLEEFGQMDDLHQR